MRMAHASSNRSRGLIARGALPLALLAALVLAMLAAPDLATAQDDPPPDSYIASDSEDMDGDGIDDTVVAEPAADGPSEPGKVQVESGENGETIATIRGREDGDQFGYSVSAMCDVNNDEQRDLLAGAPKEKDGEGRAYVFLGPLGDTSQLTAADADLILQSPDSDTYAFGRRIECLPDLDGDARAEILVEALTETAPGVTRVRTYIFSGDDGDHIQTIESDEGGGGMAALSGLPACYGDISGPDDIRDGLVNVSDLHAVIAAWGNCPPPGGAPPAECPADLAPLPTPNGIVNTADLLAVIGNWGVCDFDDDGMPDWWEVEHGLDPTVNDTQSDADMDGISNAEEFSLGTNPSSTDSDGDGTSDGQEINQGTNPADSSDGGEPDPDEVDYVYVGVGWAEMLTCETPLELWGIRIGSEFMFATPEDFAGNPLVTNKTFECGAPPGLCQPDAFRQFWYTTYPIPFKRGKSYPITVEYLGHSPTCGNANNPEYAYSAYVDTCVSADYQESIVYDPMGLLGNHYGGEGNTAEGKTAWLYAGDIFDLDIDSDNNNGSDPPGETEAEEQAEGDQSGKLTPLNNGNVDNDSIPDFADGYNLDGEIGTSDDVCTGAQFVPLLLRIKPGFDPWTHLYIDYGPVSHPQGVVIDGSNFELPPVGRLRIWKSNAGTPRSARSVSDPQTPGDFVPSGPHTLEALGWSESNQTVTLYVEAVKNGPPSQANAPPALEIHAGIGDFYQCAHSEDSVLVRTYDLEHVTWDEDTGLERPADSVAGPSNLSPELTINLSDVRLTAGGDIEIDLEGHVHDRLSELAENPAQRLQEVRFFVNGQWNDAITNLPTLSPGPGVMPWQPHLLDVNFSKTLTVQGAGGSIRPGGYVVEAITSPNAAGRTATDAAHVTVQWQVIEDLFEAPVNGATGLTITFPIAPSNAIADWAWVYFGDRDPLPTDGHVDESPNAPGSLLFGGDLLIEDHGTTTPIECSIQIAGPVQFTAQQVDVFQATVTYYFESGQSYTADATWAETAANSLRFIQNTPLAPNAVQIGDGPGGGSYFVPVIAYQADVNLAPEGPNGFMERTLIRVVGVGPNVDASMLSGMVNDVATPIAPFTYSPTKHYWVHEQQTNRPRIFVVTIDDLPAEMQHLVPDNLLISDDVVGELSSQLRANGHNVGKIIKRELLEDDFGPSASVGEPPGGPVTMPVLLTYFQLIYGNTGLQLLEFFQNAGVGGIVSLEGQGMFEGDVESNWPGGNEPMRIEIEESVDAATAATYLFTALRESLQYFPMRQEIGTDEEDLQFWIEAVKVQFQAAAGITVAATKLYFEGIAVVNQGLDFVLTINEVSSGNWPAAVGILPFVSSSLATTGKVIVKSPTGAVLAQFTGPMANAVQQAVQLPATIAARFPGLHAAGATRQQMRAFVKGRIIPAPTNHGALREAMKIHNPPPANVFRNSPQVHHELPWGIEIEPGLRSRDIFAEFGFDVNDIQYGKWVEPDLHASWSNGTGSWHAEWKAFLVNDLGPVSDVAQGRQMILDKLQAMRQGYLNGAFPLHY